ncbi:MAG: peptidoglycan DD-metalloendopeptidase family protein [Alphaproteobacteria bacterium]|nr:peptidoglycan DD-metalloendopeptidase family protein [Alphaproteobacteria bacterium]
MALNTGFAHAENPSVPLPPHKEISLDALGNDLESSKAEQAVLEKKVVILEQNLDETRGHIVETARSVQNSERVLQDLDQKILVLEKEDAEIQERLQRGRASAARLILALARLQRTPPEAMIARPEAPLKTAQSALLMQRILPVLQEQALSLKADLQRRNLITASLKTKREDAAQEAENLKKEQENLRILAEQRQSLYASTNKDLKSQQAKVAEISTQAKTLADLVKRLDAERKRQKEEDEKEARLTKAALPALQKIKILPRAGTPNLPIAGYIVTHFNEPDSFGAPSQGIRIEGRSGALVTAPMGGVIRFAGHFKNYGNMIIVEHEKGWHSLIAGLKKIDTVVGQSVSAGEPLGTLNQLKSSGENPVLYYELRHNGKATNPSEKFAGLG